MKHIKLFENNSDYQGFKSSDNFVLPNVSLIKDNNSVAYNSVPKPEVIEYQFDCRNTPWEPDEWIVGTYIKKVKGDFSELYDKIIDYLKTYGNKTTDTYYTLGEYGSEIPLENMKISALVDDYTTGEEKVCHLCWIDTRIDSDSILWGFNNVRRGGFNAGGECDLRREYFILYDAIM